jgi:hypothetical protein
MLAASELGFRLGSKVQGKTSADTKSQISTVEAAVLGVLALLLGFKTERFHRWDFHPLEYQLASLHRLFHPLLHVGLTRRTNIPHIAHLRGFERLIARSAVLIYFAGLS